MSEKNLNSTPPSLYSEREKKIEKFANYTINDSLLLALILWWLLNWKFALGCLIFALWSYIWYDQGKYADVIDEYEVGGYPEDGLRTMVKSWIVFAIIAIIVLVCYKSWQS